MSASTEILESLRWNVDCLVDNHFGEIVWLKECFNSEGKRTGITDCCFKEYPCEWHKSVAEAKINGKYFKLDEVLM